MIPPYGNELQLPDAVFHSMAQWMGAVALDTEAADRLKKMPEFTQFTEAFRRLKAHYDNDSPLSKKTRQKPCLNGSADEIWFRVLDYLDCFSLVKVMQTCRRAHDLCISHATQRTRMFRQERSLNPLQLVRAQEQCLDINSHGPPVPIPSLLLPHPVVVTGAGDSDFNGVYYCTGCNGNGYYFTKPRNQNQVSQMMTNEYQTGDETHEDLTFTNNPRQLRCILAKRFSGETLFWYASKEVFLPPDGFPQEGGIDEESQVDDNHNWVEDDATHFESVESLSEAHDEDGSSTHSDPDHHEHEQDELEEGAHVVVVDQRHVSDDEDDDDVVIGQIFVYWARLGKLSEQPHEVSFYPSQTSVLRRSDESWGSLPSSRHLEPPTVEISF